MISIRRYLASTKQRTQADPMQFVDDVFRYSLARGLCREDAEDIAIEVVQQSPRKEDAETLRMYMIGMARRKIADHYRKTKPNQDIPLDSQSVSMDQNIDVQLALDKVAENHRECLILKYVNGFTSEEIAQVLGTNADAVDSLLQRARKAFAKEWEIMHGEENGR